MKFKDAKEMLWYIQRGNDIWSPDLNYYVSVYNDLGSIIVFNIDACRASELSKKTKGTDNYWLEFIDDTGYIYDVKEWYEEMKSLGREFDDSEIDDHAMNFCKDCCNAIWLDCKRDRI